MIALVMIVVWLMGIISGFCWRYIFDSIRRLWGK